MEGKSKVRPIQFYEYIRSMIYGALLLS
jgi:hypothetical protein